MILPHPREELDGMEIRRNTVALRHKCIPGQRQSVCQPVPEWSWSELLCFQGSGSGELERDVEVRKGR